ncbi:MAG: GNAT family N-acetyltransferase [Candidatus Promineifilaceae bacterium]
MELEIDKITVVNNAADSRFEVQQGGHLAVIDYYREGNNIVFTHTGVPDAIGGQGIASKMAKTALEYARSTDLGVVPLCPFVKAYIRRHPKYQELVSKDFDG